MALERELIQKYVELRALVAEINEQRKQAQQRLDDAEDKLINYMSDADIKATAKYEGIGHVTLTAPQVAWPRYNKDQEAEVFEFVKGRGEGAIIKQGIHPSSLRAFVKGLLDNAQPVPEFITYYLKPSIKLFKIK